MIKVSYTATFSDGQTVSIAKSTREYTAAWQFKFLMDGDDQAAGPRIRTGFARTAELASKAIKSESADIRNGWKVGGKMLQKPGKILSQEIISVVKGA